jgi:cation:H+ antiporter
VNRAVVMVAMMVGGMALTWWGSAWLEDSCDKLARHHRLPAALQGALMAAIGSSMPELSSTVLSTLIHGSFDLGVSAIVGSAIFNVLVIPALSALVGGPQKASRLIVYRDAQFYLIAVAVVLVVFSLAVIYRPTADGRLAGELTRWMALIPVAIYLLYLFLHHQDARDEPGERDPGNIRPGRQWLRLGIGLVLIVAGVEGLVVGVIWLGEVFETPSFLWGATILAAGTSLPDAIVSVRAARTHGGEVSLTNVLGSNIFDLLIALPAGVLVAGAVVIDYAAAAPMMGFLTLATVVFFAMLRTGSRLRRSEGLVLLALYGLFVTWIGLETAGLVDLLPGREG